MTRIQRGFTLLEVMLVLVIMGLLAGTVVFNISGQSGQDRLKQQVQRFQVVFSMASDYAVLNQQQLGLYVDEDKSQYSFVMLDEEQNWQLISGDKTFEAHTLPDEFTFELALNDLPWDTDDSLFNESSIDAELSFSDDEISIGDEEEKKLPPPQVFLLSSGDITPFSLAFSFEPDFSSEAASYFRVNVQDSLPVAVEGPLENL
ncbi:general secretion pathway protein H [Paraglaciecola sp. T6c]|uniref:type II secretion system minor pseudopilin GspH n=1 Tax=Pseudoalteromonas atlantica (strain T6c / ATCC BAA-1087) TaxID=3042615 RepID=UPI00005C757D|nr:type II secretion system minor pseudopilin GspH [Paraglaciecola sp. T6c]ABG38767.1 general secretion pathway protein H [Paraglaciecola sp. T6c]